MQTNAKGVLPIAHLRSLSLSPVSRKPTDIEDPELEGRKFHQRKHRKVIVVIGIFNLRTSTAWVGGIDRRIPWKFLGQILWIYSLQFIGYTLQDKV